MPDRVAAVVIQARTIAGQDTAFAEWQRSISAAVAAALGFVDLTVTPPNGSDRTDWVIIERFSSVAAAKAWLRSPERLRLMHGVRDELVDRYDLQVASDFAAGIIPAAASVVISTQVKAGQEAAYRAWEHEVASVQVRSPGFQGYRFEPPVPGLQANWLATIRFDSDASVNTWMNSAERQSLLAGAKPLTERIDSRIIHSAFDQWFPDMQPNRPARSVWKQNMLTLLMLFPIVFLLGLILPTPLLVGRLGMTGPLAQFTGNLITVICLTWAVPWASHGFAWWLEPTVRSFKTDVLGAVALVALYTACIVAFSVL